MCINAGYRETFFNHAKHHRNRGFVINEKIQDVFSVITKKWVLETICGWFNGQRPFSTGYYKSIFSSETIILIANFARNSRKF